MIEDLELGWPLDEVKLSVTQNILRVAQSPLITHSRICFVDIDKMEVLSIILGFVSREY